MTEEESPPGRARLADWLRPRLLYERIQLGPTFVAPTLVLVLCAALYSQFAVGVAIPRVIPTLLERSAATESELATDFRRFVLAISLALPIAFVIATALGTWLLARFARARFPFPDVLSLTSYSFLWIAAGFLAKTLLVSLTGEAEPPTDLSFFVNPSGRGVRTVLAFTNPFAILAVVWTVKGLAAWGASRPAALLAGALPWVAWIVILTAAAGGSRRFAPSGPVSYDEWAVLERSTLTLRHPPGAEEEAADLATILDGFTGKLARQFSFEPRRIRVIAHPDHRALEQATGEFLHIKVVGSIRGQDLLYVELPGHNAARTRDEGLRETMRYVALMQLAPVIPAAPRWFVEGVAHAATHPFSKGLDRDYRTILRKTGVPSYTDLLDERLFTTPEGPVLARSVVDFLAFHHGRQVPADLVGDLDRGTSFRDALFARTRLTTSALEAGWQESIQAILGPGETVEDEEAPPPAEADTVVPFPSLR